MGSGQSSTRLQKIQSSIPRCVWGLAGPLRGSRLQEASQGSRQEPPEWHQSSTTLQKGSRQASQGARGVPPVSRLQRGIPRRAWGPASPLRGSRERHPKARMGSRQSSKRSQIKASQGARGVRPVLRSVYDTSTTHISLPHTNCPSIHVATGRGHGRKHRYVSHSSTPSASFDNTDQCLGRDETNQQHRKAYSHGEAFLILVGCPGTSDPSCRKVSQDCHARCAVDG